MTASVSISPVPGSVAGERAGGPAVLIALALAYVMLLMALIALCANYPDGSTMPYGLTAGIQEQYGPAWRYPSLELKPGTFTALCMGTLAGLWVVYSGGALWLAHRGTGAGRHALPVLIASILVFNALLAVAMPPVLSSDVFLYALHGRMVLRGENPYAEGVGVESDPPFSALTPWQAIGAEYGPVWVLVSAGLAAVGGDSAVTTALVMRGFAALCNLGGAAIVYLMARRANRNATLALALYGWNPLLLIEIAGSGHNDALMAALALLGLYLASRDKRVAAWLVLLLSMLVKYLAGLLVLLYGVFWLARAARQRRLGREVAALGLSGAGMLAAAYLPFVRGITDPRALLPGFHALANPNMNALHAIAKRLLANWAGGAVAGDQLLRLGLHGAFAVLALAALRKAALPATSPKELVTLAGWLALLYVVVIYGALFPWYLVTPMALACVAYRGQGSGWLLLWASGAAILYMLPYGLLLPK